MPKVPPSSNTSHSPNLLGAHRYTIFDGIVRSPKGLAAAADMLHASRNDWGAHLFSCKERIG